MSFLPNSRSFSDINFDQSPDIFIRALNKFSTDVASTVNERTIGIYSASPQSSGNVFSGSSVLRVCAQIPSIGNGVSTVSVPVDLSSNLTILKLYGTAQNGSNSIPLPYINVNVPSDSISLSFDLTNAILTLTTTTSNWTSYAAILIVEYFYL